MGILWAHTGAIGCIVSLCFVPPSSVAFGMRKALMAEQGKADMEQAIRDLEEEKRELE